jgi:hypothetical protein
MIGDINGVNLGTVQHFMDSSTLRRYIPEPKNSLSLSFRKVLEGLGQVARKAAPMAEGVDTEYADLLAQQMELQKQMLLVSLESNLSRTEHETQMAAVRNMRVS